MSILRQLNALARARPQSFPSPMMIIIRVSSRVIKMLLSSQPEYEIIDNGSSVDVLYHHAFSRMDIGDRRLENSRTPLYGFTGNEVHVVGTIDMPVLFGSPPCQVWKVVKFHVISASSSFNAILGRTTIIALKAITSISHLKMKFPTDFRVGEMIGDQTTARQCYLTTVSPRKKGGEDLEVNQVFEIFMFPCRRDRSGRWQPIKDNQGGKRTP
ncbi:uncharacterized protein LOC141664952 [Apium graveolens]|uniref:uncharacterized protein LOC141664952 n=1 Tax=Apium graveolens TaxID=4045 RepID=UPI003D7B975F